MFKVKLYIITPILLPYQPHSSRPYFCQTLCVCIHTCTYKIYICTHTHKTHVYVCIYMCVYIYLKRVTNVTVLYRRHTLVSQTFLYRNTHTQPLNSVCSWEWLETIWNRGEQFWILHNNQKLTWWQPSPWAVSKLFIYPPACVAGRMSHCDLLSPLRFQAACTRVRHHTE